MESLKVVWIERRVWAWKLSFWKATLLSGSKTMGPKLGQDRKLERSGLREVIANWQISYTLRIIVNWCKNHKINNSLMHLVRIPPLFSHGLHLDLVKKNQQWLLYPLCVFLRPFSSWVKKSEKPKFPWIAHPGKPWGLGSSLAFGTVECQGGWLTTNEAESSPLGKPDD